MAAGFEGVDADDLVLVEPGRHGGGGVGALEIEFVARPVGHEAVGLPRGLKEICDHRNLFLSLGVEGAALGFFGLGGPL